jgi:hypothetical protein
MDAYDGGTVTPVFCKLRLLLVHDRNQGFAGCADELTRARPVRADGVIGTAGGVGGLRQQSKHSVICLNSNHSRCL